MKRRRPPPVCDPDAPLHRLNQDYSRGYLDGLFAESVRENLPEYRQGHREGCLARVLEPDITEKGIADGKCRSEKESRRAS